MQLVVLVSKGSTQTNVKKEASRKTLGKPSATSGERVAVRQISQPNEDRIHRLAKDEGEPAGEAADFSHGCERHTASLDRTERSSSSVSF